MVFEAFTPVPTAALPAGLERQLGYFGQDRFVAFCYEPRGQEVVWRDSRSYGFGTGAWLVFLDRVLPLAEGQGVDVGSDESRGDHVLLIDRLRNAAYFAERGQARQFLDAVARPSDA